jgi:hypothetical protein
MDLLFPPLQAEPSAEDNTAQETTSAVASETTAAEAIVETETVAVQNETDAANDDASPIEGEQITDLQPN